MKPSLKIILSIIFILLIIIITFLNISSLKKETFQILNEKRTVAEIVENNTVENVNDVTWKVYSNKELKKIKKLNLNLEELDELYRVEYIKKIENNFGNYTNNEILYRVVFKSKNKYLIIYYNESGQKNDSYIQSPSYNKDKFDFVKINETKQNQVYFTLRGKGEYVSFKSRSDMKPEKMSFHLTADGYLVIIQYNNKIVTSITYELI